MKKLLLIIMLLLCVAGCGQKKQDNGKLSVTASFYPIAEFTNAVGGDNVDVYTLVPDGVEPHDWEPSPRDFTRLGRSKLFFYNGMVESWAEKAITTLSDTNIKGVELGKGLYNINGNNDPHVWISPQKAIIETNRIVDALSQNDPKNADAYKKRGDEYCQKLKKLDADLKAIVKQSPKKKFVTSHAAFGHLAKDYGLEQLAIAGISPEAEPTPADMKNLVELVKKENVKFVFMETLTSPKLAQLIAKETGAEVLVLDPIEGLDEEGRKEKLTYIKLMEANIKNLAKALK
ncbi:MAG: zinc ABC transporter substrate-binding protein [Phascolarctobacterium sp.]|nr:zinc ABC transporter substrate-binding protein [Phascolarctobacterium sp.]